MKKTVVRKGKSLTSTILITALLLTSNVPSFADGFVFEDWDSGSVEKRASASSATESDLDDDAVVASGSELPATSSIALFAGQELVHWEIYGMDGTEIFLSWMAHRAMVRSESPIKSKIKVS